MKPDSSSQTHPDDTHDNLASVNDGARQEVDEKGKKEDRRVGEGQESGEERSGDAARASYTSTRGRWAVAIAIVALTYALLWVLVHHTTPGTTPRNMWSLLMILPFCGLSGVWAYDLRQRNGGDDSIFATLCALSQWVMFAEWVFLLR